MMEKRHMNDLESTTLIALLQTLTSSMETMKEMQRTANATIALLVAQMIELRTEIAQHESENLVTRAWRTEVDIKALEAKDAEYAAELKKVSEAQSGVQTQLETIKGGRGQTKDLVKTIVADALHQDKIDIRGIKIPSRLIPYILLAVVVIIILLIFLMPDVIANLLYNLSNLIAPRGVTSTP